MVTLTATIRNPNLGKRGTASAFKAAIDYAWLDWRRRSLPKHFKPEAVALYGGEYRKHKPRTMGQTKFADNLRAMTPSERANFYADRRKMQARNAHRRKPGIRNIDPENRIPLVQTGRLRLLATRGAVRHGGPAKSRSMTLLGLPGYVDRNPINQINKRRAIKTMNAADNRLWNEALDKQLTRELRKKR
jgi:hypothetical protein